MSNVDFPPGPFATVVVDPPWPSMHQRSTYHRGKPERHYETMALAGILALPVGDIAEPDAHLWVWGINRSLPHAFDAVTAWGFTVMSMVTWCKPGPGMGYYLRGNTEHVIFATRGKPRKPDRGAMSTWYHWPRGAHSAKPDQFYELAELVSPGPRADLFARKHRPGWTGWGDQLT